MGAPGNQWTVRAWWEGRMAASGSPVARPMPAVMVSVARPAPAVGEKRGGWGKADRRDAEAGRDGSMIHHRGRQRGGPAVGRV